MVQDFSATCFSQVPALSRFFLGSLPLAARALFVRPDEQRDHSVRRISAAGQHLESPIRRNLRRGADKRAPGRQRETGTDRDPAHPEVGKLSQRQLRIEPGDEDVNRFRSNRPNDGIDLLGLARARSVKTISASFGVGHKTLKRCPQWIGMIPPETLRNGQSARAPSRIRRLPDARLIFSRLRNPSHKEVARFCRSKSFFNRQAGYSCRDAASHVDRNSLRIVGKAAEKISVYRQRRGGNNFPNVCRASRRGRRLRRAFPD